MGLDDFDPAALEQTIRRNTASDDYLARNISRICEKYLGSKLYANIMMLGFAFQKGLIPVSMHSMAWAIKDTIRTDFRKNLYAFNMGRKLVVQEDLFPGPPPRADWRDVLEEKCRWTIRRYRRGAAMADESAPDGRRADRRRSRTWRTPRSPPRSSGWSTACGGAGWTTPGATPTPSPASTAPTPPSTATPPPAR